MKNKLIQIDNSKIKLTEKQKALCDYLVANGGSVQDAAVQAGYLAKNARISGYKALKLPQVAEYLHSQINTVLGLRSARALNVISKLSESAKSEYVRLESSKDILDRAGFKAPEKNLHLHSGDFKINIDLG